VTWPVPETSKKRPPEGPGDNVMSLSTSSPPSASNRYTFIVTLADIMAPSNRLKLVPNGRRKLTMFPVPKFNVPTMLNVN